MSIAIAALFWLYAARAVTDASSPAAPLGAHAVRRVASLGSMPQVLAVSLFAFLISHGLSNWLPEILTDLGQSDNAAGFLAAMSITAGIGGSLAIARLAPSNHRAHALVLIFALNAVLTALVTVLSESGVVAALAVIGFCRAGIIPLLFLQIMADDKISLDEMGLATGLFFAVGQVGGFGGPYVVGWVADRTSGFTTATLVLAAAGLAGAIASLRLAASDPNGANELANERKLASRRQTL